MGQCGPGRRAGHRDRRPRRHRPNRRDRDQGHRARRHFDGARRAARAGRDRAADLQPDTGDGCGTDDRGRRRQPHAPDRKTGNAGAQSRRSAGPRDGREARAVRLAAGHGDGDAHAPGTADAAAGGRALPVPLHQPRRVGARRLPRESARLGVRSARRRPRVPGVPGRRHGRSPAPRVLRVAMGSGPQHADHGVCARLGWQRRQRQFRLPRVPQRVPVEHDQSRRPLSRPRRTADSAELARSSRSTIPRISSLPISRSIASCDAATTTRSRRSRSRRRRRFCGEGRSSNSSIRP